MPTWDTPGEYTYDLPAGGAIEITCGGGEGANGVSGSDTGFSGSGSVASATISVDEFANSTLTIRVGGQASGSSGGYNGGGNGGPGDGSSESGGGGGASDVRDGSSASDRVIVAAGGGGGGAQNSSLRDYAGDGGDGNHPDGDDGTSGDSGSYNTGGYGGTQDSGGSSSDGLYPGEDGSFGSGGDGGLSDGNDAAGGGAGAGWYGGGGGGTASGSGGGGGGGSDYIGVGTDKSAGGTNYGDGYVTITEVPPPDAPADATLVVEGTDQTDVSWDSVSDADQYRLQVSEDGGAYSTVATTANTSYTHSVSSSVDTFRYRVRAENSAGESGWTYTSTKSATISSLSLDSVGSDEASLSWDSADDVTEYNILRAESSGSSASDYSEVGSTTSTSATDSNLVNGRAYYWRIEGEYPSSNSLSPEADAVTDLPATNIDDLEEQ